MNAKTGQKKLATNNRKRRSKPFPIVAIGASAGGLEAITELLKSLPPDTGMSYVYIQHLDPSRESHLPTILGRVTKMKVLEAKHLVPIERNHLYILPPNKSMAIIDGVLTLNKRQAKPTINMPIDKFFVSLAEKQKEGAIGVVLSGNANDGTYGLKAIKTAGGLTFAQDDSAKFPGMPQSAIGEGVVDMILSPQEIGEELGRISKNGAVLREAIKSQPVKETRKENLLGIIHLLKKSTGIDFAHYKVNTIRRRILRRMLLYKFKTFEEYTKYLKQHVNEITTLYQDLLIHVTSFFRDPDTIEYLKKTLLPGIVKSKTSTVPIRIWVPGCSTGEEAYSLAIILAEIIGDRVTPPIQIFATDLSELAIAKARLGLYSKNELSNVSPKRLQQFFTKIDGSYRIVKSIRDQCVFASHNIFKDPPFSRLDLISCCNLLIYLDAALQRKIMATFHYALNSKGFLVLGKSETTGASGPLFSQLERKYKIYTKKEDAATKAKFDFNYKIPELELTENLKLKQQVKGNRTETDLEKSVDKILLNKYVPASVVVNKDLEILHFRGSTGLYLEHSPGKASFNLLKMARTGLAFELRTCVHKVNKSGKPFKSSPIEFKNKATVHSASIEVSPLASDGEDKLFLVIFEEHPTPFKANSKPSLSPNKKVRELQQELLIAKENMRSILEEQETGVEELQSANEEIVSSNEELQSINEELETSKEEVESANEELMTINGALQTRNEQLSESYEYSQAVFDTIREAVIVLDKDFRVKSANKAFYSIFQVDEKQTESKLIYELGNRQWDIHKLRQLLEEIVPHNSHFYGFEMVHVFPTVGEKVMLLNARKITQSVPKQELILLAIEDITNHRKAQKILVERELWFRNMADNVPVMIWLADVKQYRNFFNKTWLEYTGSNIDSRNQLNWKNKIHPDDLQSYINLYDLSFYEKKPFSIEYRLQRHDGEYRWILDNAKPTFSSTSEFTGFIGSCTEIHTKKLIHQELEKTVEQRTHELQEINKELERSNSELQQFAYVASHDLQEPLRKIVTYSDRLMPLKGVLPDNGKNYLDKIVNSSKRMTRLIDALLNFSRISRVDTKFVRTNLNEIVRGLLPDFDLILNEKGAKIFMENLPVIEAIPVQMGQLFHNLISNALKFAKENVPAEIKISSRRLQEEEVRQYKTMDESVPYVIITFQDNGIGFDSEFAEQIFIIFQRLHSRHHYPGTGIGLALCRRIVANHGGSMHASSAEGQGATFDIILPIKQP